MPHLRSQDYFDFHDGEFWSFIHRAFLKGTGVLDSDLNKPVIGICNTFSELNKCHTHFRELAQAVKRGVWAAGGLPLEFPTISLGEPFIQPTTMLYRNLMAMDTEEMLRAQPLDGVVLLGGCDKTIPAQLMAAVSVDLPAIVVSGGPMLNGHHGTQVLGACTDCYRFTTEYHAGTITADQLKAIENEVVRSPGFCQVMGTASTMACVAEALGMLLPGTAVIPAADSRLYQAAAQAGQQIVQLVKQNLRPSDIVTPEALENAITVLMAIGGSTNAVIHLIAIAQRRGIRLPLELFDQISTQTPVIADVRPSGQYQMEEFFAAGGAREVMRRIRHRLHGECRTVTGQTVNANLAGAAEVSHPAIRTLDQPLQPEGGIAVLRGNLAPSGALIKQSAVSPELWAHHGRAVVFDGLDDLYRRIDDPDLDVTADDVLILRNVGPVAGPGMPEVGQVPIPRKLLQRGVRDMVRISDARISGTSFGALVVHAAPEAGVGGPLALVRDGDRVELDIRRRQLNVLVSEDELSRRRAGWQGPPPRPQRGYTALYVAHVLQADQGCDFDFLLPAAAPKDMAGR